MMGTIPSIPNYHRDDCHCTECSIGRREKQLEEAFELAEQHRPADCLFDGDDE